ncbi:hypothetical protein ACH4Y0_02970 [Streptomyces sp. NPDC020707]|uniref:hypothetical protein n=1 Tax=Streptomyces sp. NPDC020707 TaxID=3365084 RepID=UPI0037AD28FF
MAAAIMENSLHTDGLKEHPLVTQMIYDIGILLAYKITVEEEYLAALKLSFDPLASKEIPGPWKGWVAFNAKQLTQAQVNGEIMDHVDTQAQARQIPAYWAGQVQISLAVDGNLLDLHKHMNLTYRNWLGGMVYGKILSQIDFDPQRGEKLYEDYLLGRES